jgi:hypothetical protein
LGSLKSVTVELKKHNSDLVAVQEVRWGKADITVTEDYTDCGRETGDYKTQC